MRKLCMNCVWYYATGDNGNCTLKDYSMTIEQGEKGGCDQWKAWWGAVL